LALELAPVGVRVNAVCPGDVDSPMLRGQAAASVDPDAYVDKLLRGYPQGSSARFIRPTEVAELIWFLCQPAAAPITGANLSIDFGLSAGIT
jgi:NAD(P)-dependent dehydrogenase (short-subunit alcohol dehydrogenase family)